MQHQVDLDAVRTVVLDYVEGIMWGERDRLQRAFHPRAIVAGHYKGDFHLSPAFAFVDDWFKMGVQPRGADYVADIVSIDITVDAATSKVTYTSFGDDFTAYLTFVKYDGNWRIMSKAYSVRTRSKGTS